MDSIGLEGESDREARLVCETPYRGDVTGLEVSQIKRNQAVVSEKSLSPAFKFL